MPKEKNLIRAASSKVVKDQLFVLRFENCSSYMVRKHRIESKLKRTTALNASLNTKRSTNYGQYVVPRKAIFTSIKQ